MPQGVEVLTGKEITKENQSDIRKTPAVLQHPAARVRRRRPVRRRLHHLQHVLDHRRPAPAGERAAAGHRRQPAPGASCRCSSSRSWSASSPPSLGFVAGILTSKALEWFLSRLGVDIPSAAWSCCPARSSCRSSSASRSRCCRRSCRRSAPRRCRRWRRCATSPSSVRAASDARLDLGPRARSASAPSCSASAWPASPGLLGLAIPIIFIGVFVLGPLIARPVARFLGCAAAPAPRRDGHAGAGERDAQPEAHGPHRRRADGGRRPRGRHLGAGVVDQGVGPRASSRSSSPATSWSAPRRFGFGGLPLTVAQQLNQLPGGEGRRRRPARASAKVAGKDSADQRRRPGDRRPGLRPRVHAGVARRPERPDGIDVSKSRAERDNLSIGDTVAGPFLNGTGPQPHGRRASTKGRAGRAVHGDARAVRPERRRPVRLLGLHQEGARRLRRRRRGRHHDRWPAYPNAKVQSRSRVHRRPGGPDRHVRQPGLRPAARCR